LLSVVKQRENSKKAKRWILGGSVLGGLTSLAIGVLVYYVLSVVAFGTNSQLINGYSGVFSSVMLVFVGIWMHKSSDVQKMTSFYKEKSQNSATGGVAGLAALAFLAVIREGLEIVIFIIGLVGKVSMQQLIAGFLLGTFLLAVVAIVLFVFERRLPLKAFFTLSSLVIFYLAIKFMGSGIHSLQLANQLPNQVETYLPTVTALSIYPSWISFIPQLLIIGIIIVYLLQRKKENSHEK
jgi:high-affinity iron transporter